MFNMTIEECRLEVDIGTVDEMLLPASVGTVVEAADDSSSVAFACILGAAAGISWTLEMTSLVGTGIPLTRSAALALKNRSSNLE